jgi:enamine deaminase RidA (YjgF/YER057c/UK114 family)
MEGFMPVDKKSAIAKPGSRLRELGLALPKAPTPLGAYVATSEVGSLLFLSGMLPFVNHKLSMTGRLGENLSVKEGREAARIAAMNALAVAQQHLGRPRSRKEAGEAERCSGHDGAVCRARRRR